MVFFFHLFSIIAIFLFNRAELYLIKMVIGFELSDKQKELQKKAREFALNEILPVVNYFDEHDQFHLYLLKQAWAAGLNNLQLPDRYGGLN